MNAPTDLRFAKLDVAAGDYLIFKTDFQLTTDQVIALRDAIKRQLPPGVAFVLMVHGVQVSQLSERDVPLNWQSADIVEPS